MRLGNVRLEMERRIDQAVGYLEEVGRLGEGVGAEEVGEVRRRIAGVSTDVDTKKFQANHFQRQIGIDSEYLKELVACIKALELK